MRVRALKYYYYDKIEHQIGDEFEMDDRGTTNEVNINILCAIGTIEKIAGAAPVAPAPTAPLTRAMEPEPVAQSETTEEPEPATRKYYRRRDMRAEK